MPLVVPGISPASKNAEAKKSENQTKPTIQQQTANPGPVIPENTSVFENKPSREQQEIRKQELNQ